MSTMQSEDITSESLNTRGYAVHLQLTCDSYNMTLSHEFSSAACNEWEPNTTTIQDKPSSYAGCSWGQRPDWVSPYDNNSSHDLQQHFWHHPAETVRHCVRHPPALSTGSTEVLCRMWGTSWQETTKNSDNSYTKTVVTSTMLAPVEQWRLRQQR